jgi:hypothetical protein
MEAQKHSLPTGKIVKIGDVPNNSLVMEFAREIAQKGSTVAVTDISAKPSGKKLPVSTEESPHPIIQ